MPKCFFIRCNSVRIMFVLIQAAMEPITASIRMMVIITENNPITSNTYIREREIKSSLYIESYILNQLLENSLDTR